MKVHPAVKELLDDIEAFREKHQITVSQFGLRAVNDGNFVRALRMGRTPSLITIDKARKFMQSYKRKVA